MKPETWLHFDVDKELKIPDGHFRYGGCANLIVYGASYGGSWILNVYEQDQDLESDPDSLGQIETAPAARAPEVALTSAAKWLWDYAESHDIEYVGYRSMNHKYGPDEAPFFTMGVFVLDSTKNSEGDE